MCVYAYNASNPRMPVISIFGNPDNFKEQPIILYSITCAYPDSSSTFPTQTHAVLSEPFQDDRYDPSDYHELEFSLCSEKREDMVNSNILFD